MYYVIPREHNKQVVFASDGLRGLVDLEVPFLLSSREVKGTLGISLSIVVYR